VKVHNTSDWIRHGWKVKKGYLKIHFAVDFRTGQVVSMDVSSEKVHDGKRLKRLVKRVEGPVVSWTMRGFPENHGRTSRRSLEGSCFWESRFGKRMPKHFRIASRAGFRKKSSPRCTPAWKRLRVGWAI
jgi:hypothetical protein